MTLPPGPWLPPLAQAAAYALRPFDFLDACVRRHGDLFTLRMPFFGTLVCASRPEAIRQIFTGDPALLRVGEGNADLRPLIGDHSILLLDGARHLRHRRLMLSLFQGEQDTRHVAAMRDVAAAAIAAWPEGEPTALHARMKALTLDVFLRAALGAGGQGLGALHAALARLLCRDALTTGPLLLVPALQRDLGPLTPWAALRRDIAAVDALIYEEIARRRGAAGPGRGDLLGALMEAADDEGPLTDAELRDELVTLIIAGHETTSTSLCWAVEAILRAPAALERLTRELAEVTAGGPLEPAHLARLPYLDAVVKETLRLYPVVPILGVGRVLKAPMELSGRAVPAGVKVVPAMYATHRRPDLYPEPGRFLPERFLGKKIDPYTWLPFGGGVRRCLGMAFALTELKVVLATLLLEARLALVRSAPPRAVLRGVAITPDGGTEVVLRRARARRAPALRRDPTPDRGA